METFLSKQANSILDTFDTVLAYLREHVDAQGTQELDAAYGNASALEIMCNVAATTDMTNQMAVMKKAYGPLVKQCGKLLEQKPDASLEVYLMFSGMWGDGGYILSQAVPLLEQGLVQYPDNAQLHFNVGTMYLSEADNSYFAKRWDEVVQYVEIGSPYLEKARQLNPKLNNQAMRFLRTMRHRRNVAERQIGECLGN